MSRYTQWFSPDVKPVHVGVYKRRQRHFGIVYALWTGTHWRVGHQDKRNASREFVISVHQPRSNDLPWQGLRKKS